MYRYVHTYTYMHTYIVVMGNILYSANKLAVENVGEFGESILILQNFAYHSLTVHMILSCDVS